MGYKNKEVQREYQQEWYKRKKKGINTKIKQPEPLTNEERQKRKLQINKNYENRIRKERDQVFGSKCYFCGYIKQLRLHKKDGVPHIVSIKVYKKAIKNPQEWVKLCAKCHTGVHFCMDILKYNWDQINEVFQQELT